MRRVMIALLFVMTLLACSNAQPKPVSESEPTEVVEEVEEAEPEAAAAEEVEDPTPEPTETKEPTPEPTVTATEEVKEPTATPEPTITPTQEVVSIETLFSGAEIGGLEVKDEFLTLTSDKCKENTKIKQIEAVDELTTVFTMCNSDPAFPAKVASESFGIQPLEHLLNTGGSGRLLEEPIGTGPYQLEEWVRGEELILKRYDAYWGDAAQDERMSIRWAADGPARLVALQNGEVDQAMFVAPEDFYLIEEDEALMLLPTVNPNTFYLGMNGNKQFSNAKVRRAIAQGINREELVDWYYPAYSEVASHFAPCSIPAACEGDSWYEFDPEKAQKLLKEAGHPNGFETVIYYRDVFRVYLPEPKLLAEEIQYQLLENLNIDASLVDVESEKFLARSTAGQLGGIYLLGWGAYYAHPVDFLDVHFERTNPQFGRAHSKIYKPLDKAAERADIEETRSLYEEANDAIKELVPAVPIAHGALAHAARADITGAHNRPFGPIKGALVDTPDDTFTLMGLSEPLSLYCGDESDHETLRACAQMVEPLLTYDMDSGATVPALATTCEGNKDATKWTCTLREGITFHDGSQLDANDVVMSYAIGLDASSPYHKGNTGEFEMFDYMWGLMNVEEEEQ